MWLPSFQSDDMFLNILLLISIVGIIVFSFGWSPLCVKWMVKRFIRKGIRKFLLDPTIKSLERGIFATLYQNNFCHLQKINNELLRKILRNNGSCAFFVDRSISFVSSIRKEDNLLINENCSNIQI
jgi:hypothetical protein